MIFIVPFGTVYPMRDDALIWGNTWTGNGIVYFQLEPDTYLMRHFVAKTLFKGMLIIYIPSYMPLFEVECELLIFRLIIELILFVIFYSLSHIYNI